MKKIAITKNGYDVLRIIELNSDKDKCAFKIVPKIDLDKLNIKCMRMYSLYENIEFDSTKIVEITYHKSDGIHSTKIHIKMIDKDNKGDIEYKTLPLERLIDPDVNTEIPIPLLKIVVPDSLLTNKYQESSKYVKFDMENNNIFEIFMTKKDFIYDDSIERFPYIYEVLMGDSLEFFTSGVFIGYNIKCTLNESVVTNKPKNAIVATNITDDIGLLVLKVFDPRIKEEKASMFFIENEFYLPISIDRITIDRGEKQLIYEYDLENNTKLTKEEKEKYKYYFEKQIKKYNKFHSFHQEEYLKIVDYINKLDFTK